MKRKLKRRFYSKFKTRGSRYVRNQIKYRRSNSWGRQHKSYNSLDRSWTYTTFGSIHIPTFLAGLSKNSRVYAEGYGSRLSFGNAVWEQLTQGRPYECDMVKCKRDNIEVLIHEKKTDATVQKEG